MTALAPLPVSTATNAYERMQEVNRAILEEPARLHMGGWCLSFQDPMQAKSVSGRKSAPACGTIGCYAGWVNFLNGDYTNRVHPGLRALEILAKNEGPLSISLYNAFLMPVRDDYNNPLSSGTRAYARAVVKRFRAIMKEYEKELKAVPIITRAKV